MPRLLKYLAISSTRRWNARRCRRTASIWYGIPSDLYFSSPSRIKLQGSHLPAQLSEDKIRAGLDVLPPIVDPRDDRDTEDELPPLLCQAAEVLQNELVAHPGILAVEGRIHQLEVRDDEVGIGQNLFHLRPAGTERGLAAGVVALRLAGAEEGLHKIALDQRVPARDGHAAARALVVALIPADEFHALLHRHLPAPLLERVGGAFLVAGQAVRAFCPVNARQLARRKAEDVSLRAAVLTPATDFAADAFGPVNPNLGLRGPAFGVGAPLAPQRAAL